MVNDHCHALLVYDKNDFICSIREIQFRQARIFWYFEVIKFSHHSETSFFWAENMCSKISEYQVPKC